ncbi:pollen-specific leucine-rich repeat extensin-like protein 4 [Iris pallida]|uniref:Pollen-specific leucine-rich repeat extensin-like protein 4 n=1 Tax=Iris pallida TaxID=29817 RepID=A0AAX6HDI8_IRIPA|nr:pollen-specific leucine-rich repeat extensin-like protein 4 [Iris pallida]
MAKLASTTTTATATTVAILPLLEIVKASQVARGQGRRRRCTYVCVFVVVENNSGAAISIN